MLVQISTALSARELSASVYIQAYSSTHTKEQFMDK